jgi:uncharacterized protein
MESRRIKPSGKVFRDPIHRLIRIDRTDEFALDLIDTPEFQRLRRVRQLGVSWITYPGAEHSRFVHSLGVFNFVQRMLEVLERRYAGHEIAKYLKEQGQVVKAAALLHDIGHGPFSHMIERAFSSNAHHEKKTVGLIKDERGSIRTVLDRHGIDFNAVADLIQHTSAHPLLTDLVSSQLDADRMDYLLRDSYCTGVQYGLYDAEWLLNAMCVGRNPRELDGNAAHHEWRLALDERRGEKAAEQFILARAHMNEQVYFHRVTRGFEAMLLNLFQLAASSAQRGDLPTGTPEVVHRFFLNGGQLNEPDWLAFDESVLVSAFHAWARSQTGGDRDIPRLASAFLNRDRLYGCASIGAMTSLDTPKLVDALREAGLEQGRHWCTDSVDSAIYKGLLSTSGQSSGDDEEDLVGSILLAPGKPEKRARRIEATSRLMANLDRQRQIFLRLYFDRAKQPQVHAVLSKFKSISIESSGDQE